MKRIFALALVLVMAFTLVACSNEQPNAQPDAQPNADAGNESASVMTYAEYDAAALDSEVVVECYVQDAQGWWEKDGQGVITVYAQDSDGAYFLYEMKCSEADAAKLVPGTKIKVTGYKSEWEGEVEITDGTFEFLDGSWIAEPMDATDLLGTDDLIKHQNKKVSFKGLTVEAIEYKNGEPGDDIYVTVGKDGASYSFCVEAYLTGPDTEVYKAVGALKAGDVVDMEGFLYWYAGVNTHITAVSMNEEINKKSEGVMTYAEYDAAALDSEVVVECYVQNAQGWWEKDGQGVITVYAQDPDGAYFLYEMACAEADAAKLVPGAKIKVTGYKSEWEGEVEIMDATFEFVDGSWIASPLDVTALLGTDELIAHQNKKVSFKGLTVEAVEYKNGEPGDDIYVTVSKDGVSYDFCVEVYLTGSDTEVYQAVGALKAGDVVDMEGFLYWYAGVNTHITAVTPAQ